MMRMLGRRSLLDDLEVHEECIERIILDVRYAKDRALTPEEQRQKWEEDRVTWESESR